MFTKQKPDIEMSTVFTELAKSVVNVLLPQTLPPLLILVVFLPVNLQTYAQNIFTKWGNYIAYELGGLTESEFKEQEEPILSQLKKFTPA